jgi:hypothetical protein
MFARRLIAAALACAAAAAAVAQEAAQRTSADPAPPGPVPAYHSPFERYRPYAEEPLGAWRELNDTVGRVGGHMGALRAGPPAAPPAARSHPQSPRKEMEMPRHGSQSN